MCAVGQRVLLTITGPQSFFKILKFRQGSGPEGGLERAEGLGSVGEGAGPSGDVRTDVHSFVRLFARSFGRTDRWKIHPSILFILVS